MIVDSINSYDRSYSTDFTAGSPRGLTPPNLQEAKALLEAV